MRLVVGMSGARSPRSLKSKARAGIGHPFVGAEASVDHLRPVTRTGRQAPHRGTPPVDVRSITAGLLARGSRRLSGLPGRFCASGTIDSRSPLTVAGAAPALSCDAPGSLLAPNTH